MDEHDGLQCWAASHSCAVLCFQQNCQSCVFWVGCHGCHWLRGHRRLEEPSCIGVAMVALLSAGRRRWSPADACSGGSGGAHNCPPCISPGLLNSNYPTRIHRGTPRSTGTSDPSRTQTALEIAILCSIACPARPFGEQSTRLGHPRRFRDAGPVPFLLRRGFWPWWSLPLLAPPTGPEKQQPGSCTCRPCNFDLPSPCLAKNWIDPFSFFLPSHPKARKHPVSLFIFQLPPALLPTPSVSFSFSSFLPFPPFVTKPPHSTLTSVISSFLSSTTVSNTSQLTVCVFLT